MNNFVLGILCCLACIGITATVVLVHVRSKSKKGSKVRLLARQYQTMIDSAEQDVPVEVLANPDYITSRMEFRKIDAIERELVAEDDKRMAIRLLKDFFKGDDFWVRARAAKALFTIEPKAAVVELRALLSNASEYAQLPAIWALGEIATEAAVATLLPFVWHKNEDIQQAAVRCFVQMESRNRIPSDCIAAVKKVLKEVRFKTDLIL